MISSSPKLSRLLAAIAAVLLVSAGNLLASTTTGSTPSASFPPSLESFQSKEQPGLSVGEQIAARAADSPFSVWATLIFILAILHSFAANSIKDFAHHKEQAFIAALEKQGWKAEYPEQQAPVPFGIRLLHYLGEVEIIFALWVLPLLLVSGIYYSFSDFKHYLLQGCNGFTEPLFVVAIMIIAASRPIVRVAEKTIGIMAKLLGGSPAAWWFCILSLAPILGSFITEPGAMTIGALLLSKKVFAYKPDSKLCYATLGLLFVNVSIGGTCSNFAAPPVVMVAQTWGWSTPDMLVMFGWKAVVAIMLSTMGYFLAFRSNLGELARHKADASAFAKEDFEHRTQRIPALTVIVCLLLLAGVVIFSHYPILFMACLMLFLAYHQLTDHHQNKVELRIPVMVGIFLSALVIHGGMQSWWLQPVLNALSAQWVMLGATILTSFNDNAAITYLASKVPNLGDSIKYAIMAGAVTGGGLTVIANAPNPAGQAILGKYFGKGVNPLKLAIAALVPTLIAYACFTWL